MNHDIDAPEVRSYLAALDARLAHLPAATSEEIRYGVREHIAEALERREQSITDVLAALGSPDDVLAGLAEPELTGAIPAARSTYQSSTLWVVATTILLPFGAFLAGIGWLFALAGLWMGTRWKVWEKIMGTLLFPGGLLGAMYLSWLPIWPTADSADVNVLGPVLPGMNLGASVATACISVAVAVYLLVVGVQRTQGATRN